MTKFEVKRFASAGELARAAAEAWINKLALESGEGRAYCVALSGGRIAGRFLATVTELAKSRAHLFGSAHFFWSDERCVPPADQESNFGLAQRLLLAPLGVPETRIHRIEGEKPGEVAAKDAEAELREVAAPNEQGQPVLDLVFLGLGEEGHVASLFPGESEEVMNSAAVFRAVRAIKPPPARVTIGYPALAAAREVWVLASGPPKAGALRASLAPNGRTPLARVLQLRQHTDIFTDIPA